MIKKTVSILLTVCMLMSASVILAGAETAYVDVTILEEDFTGYTANAAGFSVEEYPAGSGNSVLKLESAARSGYQLLAADTPVAAGASYTFTLDVLCTPFGHEPDVLENKLWYIQLGDGGNNTSLQLECWSGRYDNGYYQFRIGSNALTSFGDIGTGTDGEGLKTVSFTVDSIANTLAVTVNGVETLAATPYANVGLSEAGVEKGITALRIYSYNFGVKPIYIDNLILSTKKAEEFSPENLVLTSTEPQIIYGESDRKITLSGTVSEYLQQKASLTLTSLEEPAKENKTYETAVSKADNGAVFSFNEILPEAVSGLYNITVGGDWIVSDEALRSKQIYIATLEQVANLDDDFSALPEDLTEAKSKVESYLPMLVSQSELPFSVEKLEFVTKYFQNSDVIYTNAEEVQAALADAIFFMDLSQKEGADLLELLKTKGYLAEYQEEVISENEAEFIVHFMVKQAEATILSDAQVKGALTYAAAMTKLNNAKRSEIAEIIADYNDEVFKLDITSDRVRELDSDELYAALYDKAYTDVTKISEDWKNIIAALEEEAEEEEDNRSHGGGGGSRVNVYRTDKPEEPPKVEPLTKEEAAKLEMFNDVTGHWAEKEILALSEKGIISGYKDGSFRPDTCLTRAEAITLLMRTVEKTEAKAEISFADVKEEDWYYEAVMTAAAAGIVNGADGRFNPNDVISREEFATIIYRAMPEAESTKELTYTDKAEISDYALKAVSYLSEKAMLSGYEDGTFRPEAAITRAEATKLLYGLISQ